MSGLDLPRSEPLRRHVPVGEVVITIREWGQDHERVIVYVHGLTPWAELDLIEAGPAWAARGFRVIAPIAPGLFAEPVLDSDAYAPSAMAELYARLLTELGVAEAALVGFSWGGAIAARLAVAMPARVRALVLLDSGYSDFETASTLAELAAETAAQQERFRFPNWETFTETISAGARSWRSPLAERARAGMRAEGGAIVARSNSFVAAAALAGLNAEPTQPLWQRLAEIRLPLLALVAGSSVADRAEAAKLAAFCRALPAAEVRTVDAGHDLFADAPAEVAAIADWLEGSA